MPDPTGQTATVTGSASNLDYLYAIVARVGTVYSNPVLTSVSTGPTTLSASNYVTVGCTSTAGVVYDIYRYFTNAGSPPASGKIGTGLTTCSLADTGIVGDGTVPPAATNSGGPVASGPLGNTGLLSPTNLGIPRMGPFRYFMKQQAMGRDSALQVIGDSTGDSYWRWPFTIANWLGWYFPNSAVRYRIWNDTTQTYDPFVLVSSGAAGERYANFTKGATSHSMTMNSAALGTAFSSVDTTFCVDLAANTWSGAQVIVQNWTANNLSWSLQIASSGALNFYWSTNGTSTAHNQISTSVLPTTNTRMKIKVIHVLAADTLDFYTSTTNATCGATANWTKLGNTVTTAGATTYYIPVSTTNYELGATTALNPFGGKIYGVEIWQGGVPINPLGIGAWNLVLTDVDDSFGGSTTIDILNGSKSGANLAYYTGKQAQMLWPFQQSVFILNNGINEAFTYGATGYLAPLATYLGTVKPYLPAAKSVLLTQNPTLPSGNSAVWFAEERNTELRAWGALNGYTVIDTEEAFLLDPRGVAALLDSDGIHPSPAAGAPLTFSVIRDAFLQSR